MKNRQKMRVEAPTAPTAPINLLKPFCRSYGFTGSLPNPPHHSHHHENEGVCKHFAVSCFIGAIGAVGAVPVSGAEIRQRLTTVFKQGLVAVMADRGHSAKQQEARARLLVGPPEGDPAVHHSFACRGSACWSIRSKLGGISMTYGFSNRRHNRRASTCRRHSVRGFRPAGEMIAHRLRCRPPRRRDMPPAEARP